MTMNKIEAIDGIEVKTVTVVTYEQIANAFIGAVEGASAYWCKRLELLAPAKECLNDDIWYAATDLYRAGNFKIRAYPDDDKAVVFGKPDLRKGLALMAKNSPGHYQDLINDNDDASTHDALVQYVIFGQIVYG